MAPPVALEPHNPLKCSAHQSVNGKGFTLYPDSVAIEEIDIVLEAFRQKADFYVYSSSSNAVTYFRVESNRQLLPYISEPHINGKYISEMSTKVTKPMRVVSIEVPEDPNKGAFLDFTKEMREIKYLPKRRTNLWIALSVAVVGGVIAGLVLQYAFRFLG